MRERERESVWVCVGCFFGFDWIHASMTHYSKHRRQRQGHKNVGRLTVFETEKAVALWCPVGCSF